jgi:hypothetical protein
MTGVSIAGPSFFEKLVNAVHLDYVLKVAGVGGFVWAFLFSWHTLGLGVKAGMLASVAAWIVGSRFSRIYR